MSISICLLTVETQSRLKTLVIILVKKDLFLQNLKVFRITGESC